jgi:uncharacterized protein (TIGR00730 family)
VTSDLTNICVFAGSGVGRSPRYREAAESLGAELAERGIGLVYGASGIGLMGATADAALTAGGKVVGVIPEALLALEQVHTGLSELHVVDSMHARKAKMASLVDAFVALPGGMGTLEELLEIATWSKLGIHAKPCGVVNVDGYYDPLDSMLGHAVAENFIRPEDRDLVLFHTDPKLLLDRLDEWISPRNPTTGKQLGT